MMLSGCTLPLPLFAKEGDFSLAKQYLLSHFNFLLLMQKTRLRLRLLFLSLLKRDSSLAIKHLLSDFNFLLLMQKTRLKPTALIPLFSKEE